MRSNLEKIKQLVAKDKRICERLELPIAIRYSRSADASGSAVEWSENVVLDNIGGEGLGFSDNAEFSKGEKITIELKLPFEKEVFYIGAKVMWISRNFKPDAEDGERKFSYGLKIHKLSENDQKKFQQFISDRIFDKYLDDQGNLRDA